MNCAAKSLAAVDAAATAGAHGRGGCVLVPASKLPVVFNTPEFVAAFRQYLLDSKIESWEDLEPAWAPVYISAYRLGALISHGWPWVDAAGGSREGGAGEEDELEDAALQAVHLCPCGSLGVWVDTVKDGVVKPVLCVCASPWHTVPGTSLDNLGRCMCQAPGNTTCSGHLPAPACVLEGTGVTIVPKEKQPKPAGDSEDPKTEAAYAYLLRVENRGELRDAVAKATAGAFATSYVCHVCSVKLC